MNRMQFLTEKGVLRSGMSIRLKIDLIPSGQDPKDFVAKIRNPNGGRHSLEWHGQLFSPNSLLTLWENSHHFSGVYSVHRNFEFRRDGNWMSIESEATERGWSPS